MSEVPASKPIDPYAPIIECLTFGINQKQWSHYFVQFAKLNQLLIVREDEDSHQCHILNDTATSKTTIRANKRLQISLLVQSNQTGQPTEHFACSIELSKKSYV